MIDGQFHFQAKSTASYFTMFLLQQVIISPQCSMRTNQIKINHLGQDNSCQDNPSDKDRFRWVKYHYYYMFTEVIASLSQKKSKADSFLGLKPCTHKAIREGYSDIVNFV
jgi:hypothetical protein